MNKIIKKKKERKNKEICESRKEEAKDNKLLQDVTRMVSKYSVS